MAFELDYPEVATWVINRMAHDQDVIGYSDTHTGVEGPVIFIVEGKADVSSLPHEIGGTAVTYVEVPLPVEQSTPG